MATTKPVLTSPVLSSNERTVALTKLDTLQSLLGRKLAASLSPELRELFKAYNAISDLREDLDNSHPVNKRDLQLATSRSEYLLTKPEHRA